MKEHRPFLGNAAATLLLAASTLIALAGCSRFGETVSVPAAAAPTTTTTQAGPKAVAPRPVRTLRVVATALDDALILPADVRPRYEQRLGFRVAGKIARRLVDVGQTVAPGQILAVMDSADVAPAIAAQRAQVEAARTDDALQVAELGRMRDLRESGFVSDAALQRQEALSQAAAARLAAAQSQLVHVTNGLNFQTLRADRAGMVVGVDAEVGSVVAAGQSVLRLSQLGEKELAISVPERSVSALKNARSISAIADAVPGRVFQARLRELSPGADPVTRTYAARLSIIEADEALAWGMSSTVRIELSDRAAIVVPDSALYTRDTTPRVWIVDEASQTVRPVTVILGAGKDEGVVVTEGLTGGELIVTAGVSLLQPGQKVRIVDATASATTVQGEDKP